MSMKYNRQLPGPGELKEEYPLTPALAQLKARREMAILFISHDGRLGDQFCDRRVELV